MRGAVCNGPLKHTCNKSHICIWHSLKGACNMPVGKCRHPHIDRKNELCKIDAKGMCPNGGYCPYRHKSDQYEVFFYDRRSKKYNKYLWNDRVSPFSVYHKQKQEIWLNHLSTLERDNLLLVSSSDSEADSHSNSDSDSYSHQKTNTNQNRLELQQNRVFTKKQEHCTKKDPP